DSQKQMIEITIQEADHLNGLIGDLLDLANIDAGRLNLDTRPVPFGQIVDKALPRVKLVSEMKEIPIDVSMDPRLPTVKVDMNRMVQVVSNLLRSSLKHSTRGNRVYMNAGEKNGEVELKISHGGQGFTPDQLKTLFNGAKVSGEQPQGSQDGLRIGLAIAREILHAHGGQIGVESRGTDQGSLYWIKLPILKPQAP